MKSHARRATSSTGSRRSTRAPIPNSISPRRSNCWRRRFSPRNRPTCASTWSHPRCSRNTAMRGRWRRRTPRSSNPDPLHRLLPGQGQVADRHGGGAGRAARRRGAGVDGRAGRAARRRPQDGERRARARARRPGLPVDRHVLRVSNRIGIAEGDDPVVVEQQLCAAMPKARWTRTSDTLILHGRRICRPKPLCDECVVRDDCDYFRLVVSRQGRTRSSKLGTQNSKLELRSEIENEDPKAKAGARGTSRVRKAGR